MAKNIINIWKKKSILNFHVLHKQIIQMIKLILLKNLCDFISSWIQTFQTEVISLKTHNSMNKLKFLLWFNISVGDLYEQRNWHVVAETNWNFILTHTSVIFHELTYTFVGLFDSRSHNSFKQINFLSTYSPICIFHWLCPRTVDFHWTRIFFSFEYDQWITQFLRISF